MLKQEGISEKETQVIAIPQPEIVAAWKRGDIDGAFVWDPALSELKKDGKVLLTAGQVADRGAPTFSALVVTGRVRQGQSRLRRRSMSDLVDGYFTAYLSNHGRLGAELRERQADRQDCRAARRPRMSEQLKTTVGSAARRAGVRQMAGRRRKRAP